MDTQQFKLLRKINEKKVVSYKELINEFELSRYMISKYVEEINLYLESLKINARINFKPRIGFSIEGETNKIEELLNSFDDTSDLTKDKRIVQLLSLLLDIKGRVTIQELADNMYISRSTLENLLKDVRKLLKKYDINIIGTKSGIYLDLEEEDKRQLISKLINTYKSKLVAGSDHKEGLKISLKFSEDIKGFIDLKTINKVADIVGNFINETNLYLTEYEYNSLVIHISISIDRMKKNFIVRQESQIYDLEKNTRKLIMKIENAFGIQLPEFEKNYIDIHIKSIQQNNVNKIEYSDEKHPNDNKEISKFREITKEILSDLNPDEELIEDLTVHLKSAVNRLGNNISIRNPYLEQIKSNFIPAFEQSKRLVLGLEDDFDIEFDEDEIAYITIHIQSFFERTKNDDVTDIILVCSSGYGTSKLLEQRIKNFFGEKINIVDTVGINQLSTLKLDDVLIVTTVPITDSLTKSIYVNPLLTKKDIDKIQMHIKSANRSSNFIKLLSEDFFKIDNKNMKQKDVIRNMVNDLEENNFVKPQIYESIIEREKLSSTAIGNIAMPHGGVEYVNYPLIYVYINKNGIVWGEEKVQVVFLFLLNESKKKELDDIYSFFNEIVNSEDVLNKITEVRDFEEFIEVLVEEG